MGHGFGIHGAFRFDYLINRVQKEGGTNNSKK